MATDVPVYAEETWVPDAAPGISAAQLQRIDDQIRALTDEFNIHNGGDSVLDHPVATPSVLGMMSAGDKSKLNGVEVGATQDDFDFDHQINTAADTLLTTTFQSHHTFTYTPPGGWGNYKLAVQFQATIEWIGSTDLQTRLDIDGASAGSIQELERVTGQTFVTVFPITTYGERSGRSGAITVVLRALCEPTSSAIRLHHAWMLVIASRET